MRTSLFTAGAVAIAAALTLAGPAQAAESDAQLSVLHGVPGLTVDVWVNGERTLDDFAPGTLAGPLALPPGDYDLAITAADAADASAPVIGPVKVTLAANGNYTAVANLDAAGTPDGQLLHERRFADRSRQGQAHGPPHGGGTGRGHPRRRRRRHLRPGQPQ